MKWVSIFSIVCVSVALMGNADAVELFQSPVSPLPMPVVDYTPWPTPGWEALTPTVPLPTAIAGPTAVAGVDSVPAPAPVSEIPEPATIMLIALGLSVVCGLRRYKLTKTRGEKL